MRVRFTSRLLAMLAVVGLIAGPFASRPSIAASEQIVAIAHDHASMNDVPDGMPCCPDTQQKSDCAKDCPFMAACSGIVFPPIASGALIVPLTLLAVISPADEPELSGLAQGPPARPPKA